MSRYLLNGTDVLARRPGFQLIGRKEEFTDLCGILTQSTASSVIASGPGGVGVSALALNLQACKLGTSAPFDILSKRLFWLDTDSLFGLGDSVTIGKEFKSIFSILSRTPSSLLLVEDTIDLIEALRNCGMLHVINALNSLVKSGHTQVFLEVRDKDLGEIYRAHSDFREHYTLFDVKEPSGNELYEIVVALAETLGQAYKIKIDDSAVKTAIELSGRYRSIDTGLHCAQPERSRLLLDRAMSKYSLRSHSAVSSEKQLRLKELFANQRTGEKAIVTLEEEISDLVEVETARVDRDRGNPKKFDLAEFSVLSDATGHATPEIEARRARIEELAAAVRVNRLAYEKITDEINANLHLSSDAVISEFSRISGIEEVKLRQDDTVKLLNLGTVLKQRVYGQDDALEYVFRRVKIWKRGRRTDRPLPLMFCGPSGVGKTEICRALAEGLFDTDQALNKFDMGDFGEKNDITKLIGAPPGYEGFDVGGEMTNSIRANPYQVMLMDEIEKAHASVFNTFLSVLDSGYCKDNLGRRCEFGDAIMPFTTNLGQEAMLRVGASADGLSETDAYELTMHELEKFFKPEFLNRFEGRENIIILKKLELDSIERIANRELAKINQFYAPQISVVFPTVDLARFCKTVYSPKVGARGIPGKIKTVEGFLVDSQLGNESFSGTANVVFNETTLQLTVSWR